MKKSQSSKSILSKFTNTFKTTQLRINFLAKTIFFILVAFNIFLASWYVLNGDLFFGTDLARDFLLLEEIKQKKIILIGAHAGADGLFHGNLWPYLNFPVYFISNGNPIATGWFWVSLMVIFYISGFEITKRLFNKSTAYFFVLLTSTHFIFQAKEFTHPQGALLLMPLFFYTFWRYLNSFNARYLIFHILVTGLLIHMEAAIGAPFLVLSFIYIFYNQFKRRVLSHAFFFILIIIPLSNYILFDLRHEFFQLKSLIAYIKGKPDEVYVGFLSILKNRIDFITTSGIPLFYRYDFLNRLVFVIFSIFLIKSLVKNKNRQIYLIFTYFFLGYFAISLFNRFFLLAHHFVAYSPIVHMVFASMVVSKYKKLFLPIFGLIVFLNLLQGFRFLHDSTQIIGKGETSWKALQAVSTDLFEGTESEFGYFVYSPDKLAYAPKYAALYGQKNNLSKKSYYFEKKPITYVIAAPAPANEPYMKENWWIKNSIKIDRDPQKIYEYQNGYKVYKYELTDDELKIPFDKHEDSGLHFR